MNKITQYNPGERRKILPIAGVSIIAVIGGIKLAHELPLLGLSDAGYAKYQRESNYTPPKVLLDYLHINPYDTDIIPFGDESVFVRDNIQKRVYTITCPGGFNKPKKGYCLLRDNPYTINYGKIIFGSGIPVPKSVIDLPFELIEKRHYKQNNLSI